MSSLRLKHLLCCIKLLDHKKVRKESEAKAEIHLLILLPRDQAKL